MNVQDFTRILSTFADSPADIDLAKGALVVQVRDELIQAKLHNRAGDLWIEENGASVLASQWLINRIAKLPLLADRILSYIEQEPHFVTPNGDVLDELDAAPTDQVEHVADAGNYVLALLGRRFAGNTSVVYLTSDAGEGKTTLISELARVQAQNYKDKRQDWLLVPVSLGGRTFMRFDDVIVGSLMNRLRFPYLYYDAFIELVKLGAVVPGLDGFEEMFVEGSSGDAISALGNLVNALQSSGSVLIAARKAYFDYKSLQARTRLFDSLGGQSVSFARVSLSRWDKAKFLEYAGKRSIPDAAIVFDDFASRLDDADHPLLTRAILVRRLLDIASETDDRSRLLASIQNDPDDFFRQFVGGIITREAREKWIDKVGTPAQPLISIDDHYELLSLLASEMWTSGTQSLRPDVCDFVSELFCDAKRKDKAITHQVVERTKQHALLVKADRNTFAFDHPEFYFFFLGEAVGNVVRAMDRSELCRVLRQGLLSSFSLETAVRAIKRSLKASDEGKNVLRYLEFMNNILQSETRMSYVKENIGGILIRLLDFEGVEGMVVIQASFPNGALSGTNLSGIEFKSCYFQPTSLSNAVIANCVFRECEFEELDLGGSFQILECLMANCECRAVIPPRGETGVFSPTLVLQALSVAGFRFEQQIVAGGPAPEPDENLMIVTRMLRAYQRSTGINENTFRSRLGLDAPHFFREVLPRLIAADLVQKVKFKGSGTQDRFQLAVPLERLNHALEDCGGDFHEFLRIAAR